MDNLGKKKKNRISPTQVFRGLDGYVSAVFLSIPNFCFASNEENWEAIQPITIGPTLGQRRLPTVGVLVGCRLASGKRRSVKQMFRC